MGIVASHASQHGSGRATFNATWAAVIREFAAAALVAPSAAAAASLTASITARERVVSGSASARDMQLLIEHLLRRAAASSASVALKLGDGSAADDVDTWVDTPATNALLVEPSLAFTQGINRTLQRLLRISGQPAATASVVQQLTFDDASVMVLLLAMADRMRLPQDAVVWRGEVEPSIDPKMLIWDGRHAVRVPVKAVRRRGYMWDERTKRLTLSPTAATALPQDLRKLLQPGRVVPPGVLMVKDVVGTLGALGSIHVPKLPWKTVGSLAVGASFNTKAFLSTSYQRGTAMRFALRPPAGGAADEGMDTTPRVLHITKLETVPAAGAAAPPRMVDVASKAFKTMASFRLVRHFVVEHLMHFFRLNPANRSQIVSMFDTRWVSLMFRELLNEPNYVKLMADHTAHAKKLLTDALDVAKSARQ